MKVKVNYTTQVIKEIEVDDRYKAAAIDEDVLFSLPPEEYAKWDNLTDDLIRDCAKALKVDLEDINAVFDKDDELITEQ